MNHSVNRTIMAIGSHADDLEIYCGGTLLKYHELGYKIVYVMSTNNMSGIIAGLNADGSITRRQAGPLEVMKIRKAECEKATAMLGTVPIHLDHPQRHYYDPKTKCKIILANGGQWPEGIPPNIPSILAACEDPASVARVAALIQETNPECIITSGVSQRNIEHFATSLLVTMAFWKAVDAGFEGGLVHWLEEHTLHGESNMRFDTFIDYTGYLDRKMELIGMHHCQMPTATDPNHGHRLLAQWRSKVCGRGAAEAYNWVRRPVRRNPEIFTFNAPIYGEFTGELVMNSR